MSGIACAAFPQGDGPAAPPDGQTGTTTVPLDQRQGPSSARVRFRLMDAASGSQADCREVWGRFQRDRGGKTAGKVEFDAAEAIEARLRARSCCHLAWKHDTYPSIAKRAKKRGAEIYFWDESGFRADVVQGDNLGRTRADPGRCTAGQAAGGLGGVSCQCQRRFLVCDLHRGDERRDVHRTARGPAAPSQEALDSDSRQLARPQGESGARLRRLDRWKVGIALPAWLRTGIEPGRIGMELYEENRDREAAARQGRISA